MTIGDFIILGVFTFVCALIAFTFVAIKGWISRRKRQVVQQRGTPRDRRHQWEPERRGNDEFFDPPKHVETRGFLAGVGLGSIVGAAAEPEPETSNFGPEISDEGSYDDY